jgi:hypothetical protein
MIFGKFINKTGKYLKSVRILKNYVSFDMVFSSSWVMLKKPHEKIEILQNENNEGIVVTSFICENDKNLIDILENTVDSIIKTNIEREEKERRFKSKVQELKNIFEKENLENLKGLKFDIEELTKFIENESKEVTDNVTETTENA